MRNNTKEIHTPSLHLISVNDLAKHLNVKAGALYRQIEEHGWREEQGVFQVLPGKRGLRIDEYVFLHWRRMPMSVLGDAHVRDVTKSLLTLLYPVRAAIDQWIANCNRMYDESAVKVEEGEQFDVQYPDQADPDGFSTENDKP
jgi:hypothetical protein